MTNSTDQEQLTLAKSPNSESDNQSVIEVPTSSTNLSIDEKISVASKLAQERLQNHQSIADIHQVMSTELNATEAENKPQNNTLSANPEDDVTTMSTGNLPENTTSGTSDKIEEQTTARENLSAMDYASDEPLTPEEQQNLKRTKSMSIISHLMELRSRLIKSLIAIGIGAGISYYYIEPIMEILTKPAGKLYYMQPAEAFFTYLKVSLFMGFLLALPVVLYHIWKFVLPALKGIERYILSIIVPISFILFILGIAFSFFLVLPAAIKFLIGFSTDELQPLFSVRQYFDFIISFMLPFGFVFELPLVIIILAKIGLVTSKFLGKQQRLVIFLTFVIGAIISPTPDVFSQSMIAIPMILLYEISYVIVKFLMKK